MIMLERSTDPVRNSYQRLPISMDSGHPMFLLFGNEPAFLCPTKGYYYDENIATGYLCSIYLDQIQSYMNFLSDTKGLPRETLRTFDLSIYERLENTGGLE